MASKEYPVLAQSPMVNALVSKLASWVFPILVGAILMELIDSSGERAQVAEMRRQLDQASTRITVMEQSLASGGPPALARRVDDLQVQVNSEFNKINVKLDNIQSILMKPAR